MRAERLPRIEVAVRLVLVLALGTLAWSSVYWLLYLALPALVALDVLQNGPDPFLSRDAPRLVRALRWLASAEAYLYFLTNELPTSLAGAVDLQVKVVTAGPTAGSALARLASSLPALLLVAILTAFSSLVWLLAAICALATERIPGLFAELFLVVLRAKYKLIAYHLSLVDRYPGPSHLMGMSHSGERPVPTISAGTQFARTRSGR